MIDDTFGCNTCLALATNLLYNNFKDYSYSIRNVLKNSKLNFSLIVDAIEALFAHCVQDFKGFAIE